MARAGSRAGGHVIEAAPNPPATEAQPATASDPAGPPTHPRNRKPNPPTGGGGGGNGAGGGGNK